MRTLLLSIFSALLVACGGTHGPATNYYKLDIPTAPAPGGPPSQAALRVEPFRTSDMLKQDRIVYRTSPVNVGFYEYHRWAEHPRDTVTKAVADQLEKRRVFQSVAISDDDDRSDYVLTGTIDRLQEVDYGGVVRVQVTISVELQDQAQQRVIWSGAESSEAVVARSDVSSVVAAMGQASQQSIWRLTADVAKYAEKNRLAAYAPPSAKTPAAKSPAAKSPAAKSH
jgi:uncharacterized lipoprotein YmbA